MVILHIKMSRTTRTTVLKSILRTGAGADTDGPEKTRPVLSFLFLSGSSNQGRPKFSGRSNYEKTCSGPSLYAPPPVGYLQSNKIYTT